jgi:hypothetical protein
VSVSCICCFKFALVFKTFAGGLVNKEEEKEVEGEEEEKEDDKEERRDMEPFSPQGETNLLEDKEGVVCGFC